MGFASVDGCWCLGPWFVFFFRAGTLVQVASAMGVMEVVYYISWMGKGTPDREFWAVLKWLKGRDGRKARIRRRIPTTYLVFSRCLDGSMEVYQSLLIQNIRYVSSFNYARRRCTERVK